MDRIRLAVENPDNEEAGGAGELEDAEMLTPAKMEELRARGKTCLSAKL